MVRRPQPKATAMTVKLAYLLIVIAYLILLVHAH